MDLSDPSLRSLITLSEVHQKEKDKCYMISVICGIENITQRTDLWLSSGGVGGKDWEFGISKLLCIGWINSKVLL